MRKEEVQIGEEYAVAIWGDAKSAHPDVIQVCAERFLPGGLVAVWNKTDGHPDELPTKKFVSRWSDWTREQEERESAVDSRRQRLLEARKRLFAGWPELEAHSALASLDLDALEALLGALESPK